MKIHKYLCDKEFRDGLEEFLTENAPEILECNTNSREDSYISFTEWNHPSGEGRTYEKWKKPYPHVFTFSILAPKTNKRPGSAHCLWDGIMEDTELSTFKNRNMGVKIRVGTLYPDLDEKVRGLISGYTRSYIREERLEKLLDEVKDR